MSQKMKYYLMGIYSIPSFKTTKQATLKVITPMDAKAKAKSFSSESSNIVTCEFENNCLQMNFTAAEVHKVALQKALEAKKSRELALIKVAEQKEDVSATDVDTAKMDVLRKALGSCANRACLFSTPAYSINVAFSPESFPTDAEWVAKGGLTATDKVLDIGCGDGRSIIRAAELGATAIGYEINDDRAAEAVTNIASCSTEIQQRVQVYALNCVEVIDTQLADGVTFVYLYLTPRGLKKCLKYFRANPTPLRVVSYVNPFRELHKDGGKKVPCRKIWCESDNEKEREMGVKFPIFCYTFGQGGDTGPVPLPTTEKQAVEKTKTVDVKEQPRDKKGGCTIA